MEKLRKLRKYAFVGGYGVDPEASNIFKNVVEKSMETRTHFKIFMNYERIFTWKKRILIRLKGSMMDY